MEQKRFLTADEVFQLFGVDSQALDGLVESGAVKALADMGSFKYRSEDFAQLVQEGKLTPRTSGEQFQVDDKGEVPFLKIKDDDHGVKFDEDVSFIELDEEALNAQAEQGQQVSRTPVVPDKWFDDSDESVDSVPAVDVPVSKKPSDATDVEVTSGHTDDSDSDVQVFDDNASIDYDEPDVAPSASDSDVRLEGPAASSIIAKKPDSDSDVRLANSVGGKPKSDSDVTIAPSKPEGSAIARHGATKPDSDSDVQLASPSKPDSDSDVRLSDSTKPGSDVQFGAPDSGISFDPAAKDDSGISLEPVESDSGITLEPVAADSGIALEPVPDSGITLQMSKTDSDIKLEPDSGITLDSAGDSGITLQSSMEGDSGISLLDGDSTIRMQSSSDSGIMLATGDSGISFAEVPDSSKTLAELDLDSSVSDTSQTQSLNVTGSSPSSSFDVSVHEDERTMEMPIGGSSTEFSLLPEGDEEPAKPKSSPKLASKSKPKAAPISDSIDLDESLEVEELDISEDLDSVSSGEFSGEFAEAEPEEVLEASDDDFSAHGGELEEVEEVGEDEDYKPAAKVRSGPREPAWGMGAVIPIACSALLMLVCVTVLWGGISTMWTGAEPGGPAGILMSSLAGLPF